MILVDVLIDELVRAGADPNLMYVFAGDEQDIYRAGLLVRRHGDGVKVVATTSEGFRGGLSRVVLDYCDVIINVSRLRADARIGMWGCLANYITCVDYPDRLAALKDPERICEIAARPSVRLKARLQILDALQPIYEPPSDRKKLPPRWPYGGILVSEDPVAVDLVGWKLLEAYRARHYGRPSPLSPQPAYLLASQRYRLGEATPDTVRVIVTGNEEDALVK